MSDLISRQAMREAMYHEAMEKDSDEQKWDGGCWIRYKMFERVIESLPAAQLTLYGYSIEQLELIARVLQKENLPPDRVTEVLKDIDRIVAIVTDELEEAFRKGVEQYVYRR